MLTLNNISIRNKLILMQMYTSVVVFGIVFGVFILIDINAYKQRKADSFISLAHFIGINSISALEFQDAEAATAILLELHTIAPEIIHSEITNKERKIFASYSKDSAIIFNISEVLHGRSFAYTDGLLFVSKTIITDNRLVGMVNMQVELRELQKVKQYKYRLAYLLFFIALVFSFLIAIFIQSYISTRLLKLFKTIEKVSKTGKFAKHVEDTGKDEIAVLIKSYNLLMEQVEENLRKKDEFIGIASHELKTPLTSIKGYIEVLNLLENEQPKKQFTSKALSIVIKLEKLVNDLLDVSKIQSGQLQLQLKEFDIIELINETINSIQMITTTHQILLSDSIKNQMIYADRQRIEQVLLNLLSNAIKYSPGENKVVVETEKTQNEFIIKIKDYGMGVPPEEQSEIFERFYRTKNISSHISGFGLGLYICRNIIRSHFGKIWMESPGKGSVFYISLPLKPPVSTQQTEKVNV